MSKNAELSCRIEQFFEKEEVQVAWEPNLDRVLSRFEDENFDILIITSEASKTGEIDGIELLGLLPHRNDGEHLSRSAPRT